MQGVAFFQELIRNEFPRCRTVTRYVICAWLCCARSAARPVGQRLPRLSVALMRPGRWAVIYDVQVVRANWCHTRADWPVLGPRHEDADHLNFPFQHWHLDGRFVSADLWRKVKTEGFIRSPLASVAA